MELESERTIAVFPADRLPALAQRLLARLATSPGASAVELARGDGARRTVLEHLARLRRAGYVRMVGGGREARYHLV
jgi:DNA-binding transcriptional ArsR family regulator